MKPIIFDDVMDGMVFLNEYEKAFLNMGSPEVKEMLLKRMKMLHTLHKAWKEYNPKTGETKLLSKGEWKAKIANILQLQFHFRKEQHKGIIDNYFTKVDFPKGGMS